MDKSKTERKKKTVVFPQGKQQFFYGLSVFVSR